MFKFQPLRSKLDSPYVRILGGVLVMFLVALLLWAHPVFAQQYERGRWTAPPDLSGLDDSVLSMAFDKAGDIYVGGYFTNAGGDSNASHVAKWDGKRWDALGTGFDKSVQALAVDSKGNVYAGGLFDNTGDGKTKFSYISRWNGTQWDSLVYGLDGNVLTMAVDAQDRLYVAGDFQNACRDATCSQSTPMMHVGLWTGTQWQALGEGLDKSVNTIAVDSRGILYAGGDFSHGGNGIGELQHLAKWDGQKWSDVGGGVSGSIMPTVHSLAVDGIGDLYVAGRFALAGKLFVGRVAKWDGQKWTPLKQGLNYGVYSLVTDQTGSLYAGGVFTAAGDVAVNHVAKWDPRANDWLAVGGGLDNTVYSFAYSPQYVLFAGGDFLDADGDPNADRIAQWVTSTP
jgi:hypothetical protein